MKNSLKAHGREVSRSLENVRFEKFTLLIDGIHKSISKLKIDTAPYLGVKSVHVFWVYELSLHPEGLTAAEIAAVRMVDRSLISREIAALKKESDSVDINDIQAQIDALKKEAEERNKKKKYLLNIIL